MAILGLKEMEKFLWEGREKDLPYWLSQFSSFKPKVAIAKFVWKMQTIVWYILWSGLDAMPLFLLDDLLKYEMPKIVSAKNKHWIRGLKLSL